jgi:hypothetical protein
VVTNAREHVYDMKPLEEFTFRDERGKDQGINGRCSWIVWIMRIFCEVLLSKLQVVGGQG